MQTGRTPLIHYTGQGASTLLDATDYTLDKYWWGGYYMAERKDCQMNGVLPNACYSCSGLPRPKRRAPRTT